MATPSEPSAGDLTIFFNGEAIKSYENDTVASALYRSGVRIFSRSFKYHRPRGLLCLAGKCPNCLMNLDGVPNVRVCTVPVSDGMQIKHQNAYPSLEFDWLSIADWLSWLMPVGFYYKTFTHPKVWRLVQPLIRKIAGLGEVETDQVPTADYEHLYLHADVAVVGGGPAGLIAAIEKASQSPNLRGGDQTQMAVVDDQPTLGGHLRYQNRVYEDFGEFSGLRGFEVARKLAEKIASLPNVQLINNASCFGLYEGNLLGIAQRNGGSSDRSSPRRLTAERLIHLRAKQVVVATGSYEVPIVFENSDTPGVMLSSAVQKLINLHGVKPAEKAVVVAKNREGGRPEADQSLLDDIRAAGVDLVDVLFAADVIAATGHKHVNGIQTKKGHIDCDLIVVCGEWVPDAALAAQAGGKLKWDENRGAFIPAELPPHITAVGDAAGSSRNGNQDSGIGIKVFPKSRSFVCLCEDVTVKDICQAIDEGFDQIETLKRYTTATMGPCQGRMCQHASIRICASQTHKTMAEVGMTTSRPPTSPVSLGALTGANHHPIKRTPMHYKHETIGAVWMDMGEWKRPLYYNGEGQKAELNPRFRQGSTQESKIQNPKSKIDEEYRSVREGVGLIDLSTLGKIDVKGKDAPKLLDKVYANRLSDLQVGRVRYSVICDDSGVILDDGTVSRLSDDHYFITTTTGNAEFVGQWLEWWIAGTGWCVHITNVTGGLAAVNVAGPKAKNMLAKPPNPLADCDLSPKAFPYMSCRQSKVGGVPCLMIRIGFVGETGWEIHFPAEYGEYLWDLLIEAGNEFGLRPFGVETQRILRLEKKHAIVGVDTDATSNPIGSDMAWVAKMDKDDFIGRAAILRIQNRGIREKLVGFLMQDNFVPTDGSAIVKNGEVIGRVTSSRFSPVNKKGVGMAWLIEEFSQEGKEISIQVDGQLAKAKIMADPFYDAQGERLKM